MPGLPGTVQRNAVQAIQTVIATLINPEVFDDPDFLLEGELCAFHGEEQWVHRVLNQLGIHIEFPAKETKGSVKQFFASVKEGADQRVLTTMLEALDEVYCFYNMILANQFRLFRADGNGYMIGVYTTQVRRHSDSERVIQLMKYLGWSYPKIENPEGRGSAICVKVFLKKA